MVPPRLASADQISDAQAQASALTAKIAAEQQQIQSLTSQYDNASYKVSQLNAQIAQSQAQLAKDQAEVDKDQSELKTHTVADYMSNGTSNQFTQMFTGDNNAAGIHNEYSSIASGNVTNTVDQLHTAQTQLHAQQDALQQQQSQATAAANAASSAKNQASQLAASDASALNGVNANIKNLVAQQQAAAAAAAAQAAQAKVVAAQQAQAAAQSSSNSGGGGAQGPGRGADRQSRDGGRRPDTRSEVLHIHRTGGAECSHPLGGEPTRSAISIRCRTKSMRTSPVSTASCAPGRVDPVRPGVRAENRIGTLGATISRPGSSADRG